ncbi:MAG: hypothetical protein V4498_07985 [candidate division FCPU426 bacterium]
MEFKKDIPVAQPTESEAIVAAQRAAQTPGTALVAPVPLPIEKAAALVADKGKGAAPGSSKP